MNTDAFEFARPLWLLAGAVACGLVLAGMFWVDRRRTADLARLVHPRFHARLTPSVSPGLRWARRVCWLLSLMLFCTAAAGPQMGFEWREVKRRGIDILFAIDTSRSMLAEDLKPNRLERARMGIHDFIDRLEGDRVGLVPFAGSSYPLCPLTVDYAAFRDSLDVLDTDIIPKSGTDVAAAIREAQKLLDQQGSAHRILVLITDGEDLQGDALDAAKEAKEKDMTIFTVGVGSAEGVQIPVVLPNGQRDFLRDESGQPVTTKLDEAALREIADVTGGLYAPLGRGAEGLDMIYQEKLRLMPKNELESKREKIPLLCYEWPLAAALLLLLMTFLLPERRREAKALALPSAARRKPVPGVSLLLAAGAALVISQGQLRAEEDARALYNEGTAAYDSGDYTTAVSKLRESLKTSDLKLQNNAYYNLGNALYKQSKDPKTEDPLEMMEQAKAAYEAAAALNPGDEDALHNRNLVAKKIEEIKNQDGEGGGDGKNGKEGKDKKGKDKEGAQKDGQQKDGQQKDGQQKDGQQKDGQQEDSQQKDGQQKDGQQKDGQQKDQQSAGGGDKKDEKKEGAGQEQKDGKEGEKKDAAQAGKEGDKKDDKKSAEAKSIQEERSAANEMSAEEARRLLQSLRREERTVIPIDRPTPQQRRFRDPNNTTKGKTW